jgi:hypothetical protein
VRFLATAILLAAGQAAAAGPFANRIQDSLPPDVRLTAMNCRGTFVVLRGETPDHHRLALFLRGLAGQGIATELQLTHIEKTTPPVLTFLLHAREAKPSGAELCAGLPERFPVVRVESPSRQPPVPCPGPPNPARLLDRESVETLRLVGVMTKEEVNVLYAIVQGSGDQLHRVRVGDRIGAENACVLRVSADGMTVMLPDGERRIPLATE